MEHSIDALSIALSDAQVQAELDAISVNADFDDDAGDSAWDMLSVNSTPSRYVPRQFKAGEQPHNNVILKE